MKFILIPSFMAGLVSFGAMAQAPATPATNPAPGSNFTVQLAPTNKPAAATNAPAVAPDKGDLSDAMGAYYGNYMVNHLILGLEPKEDLDMGRFFAAYSNVVVGAATAITSAEASKILMQQQTYEREQLPALTNKLMAMGPENKAQGEKFMEEMAGKPNVVKLADGVIYTVIKQGDGATPTSNDTVVLSFRATLVDGKEVWKIERAPGPVTHPLIPPGITEVLTQMKVGSHWVVNLPYTEAYGEKPGLADPRRGYKVGPYSALIFDLELESVQPKPASPPGMPPGMGAGQRPGGPMTMPPNTPVTPPGASAPVTRPVINSGNGHVEQVGQKPHEPHVTLPVTSSPIVRVPSAEEMEKGEQPRVLTDAEVEAAKKAAQTNPPATNAPAP
jgi:FKBP-type peptidyl-prolyl cis-trans isomerase